MGTYHFLPLDQHFDGGFGATGEAFFQSAKRLRESGNGTEINAHLPINFLYRHAIELFLKSMILVLHRSFDIPFDQSSCNSGTAIQVKGKWVPMHRVHCILDLFGYFRHLLITQKVRIAQVARTNWSDLPDDLPGWIDSIDSYDKRSTFFRYPSGDSESDSDKSSWQETTIHDVFARMAPGHAKSSSFLLVDQDDNIQNGYIFCGDPSPDLSSTLHETASLLSGAHFGMRLEFADGM